MSMSKLPTGNIQIQTQMDKPTCNQSLFLHADPWNQAGVYSLGDFLVFPAAIQNTMNIK